MCAPSRKGSAAVPDFPVPAVLHIDEQRGWRGGEQQMVHLACGLQERGIRTALALRPGTPAVQKARREGLRVFEVPMRGEFDLSAALRIARTARANGFNILHSHTAHAQALAQLAAHAWRAGARVVAHRRIEFPVGKAAFGVGRLKYMVGVDAYIAISNRVKETLLEAGVPEWRVFPVHSATDFERFARVRDPLPRSDLGIPEDAFVVGNVAALVGHKDHRNLLEACRIVCDRIPHTWVVIVGSGPLRPAIEDKAESLHMSDRVVMTGFRWDVPQLLKMFDVFALSSSEEGMCSTLTDVAAAGCPMVATDAGGVREVVVPDETGVLVPIRSPRLLAEGIIRLAQNHDEARRLAQAAARRVRAYFSTDVLAERTLAVYRRVLSAQVGPDHPVGFCED